MKVSDHEERGGRKSSRLWVWGEKRSLMRGIFFLYNAGTEAGSLTVSTRTSKRSRFLSFL
jgi:hypothetical protein